MANTTTLVKPLFEHARKVPFNIAPAQGARLASEMFRKKGWVFLNEAEIGQGSDHPPAFNRFREASALFQGLGFRSPALENATYLFKVVFDPEAVSPSFENPSEGFDWMVERLEQLFPR